MRLAASYATLLLVPLGLLALTSCDRPGSDASSTSPDERQQPPAVAGNAGHPGYAGSEACRPCHAEVWQAWRGSHHDLALQVASEASVLGDFSTRHGSTEFEKDGNTYTIRPTPAASPREVRYTFGVSPLQQYLVDGDAGALQSYPVAWDGRHAGEGGQRWFDLYPQSYLPGDPMHWNGRANRWNSQCADCHSTAVEKRYDPQSGNYTTRYAVEDVGCEACHGPGSAHVATPSNSLSPLSSQADEINACAPCHSRRAQIAEGFRPDRAYLDYYAPALLEEGLYYVDGQIRDEVYVYGSFLASAMHRAGVTCSDCHEPHRAALARPGNATCTLCHQDAPEPRFAAAAGHYDSPEHHLHPSGSPGAQCVACHMPATTYMGVDDRRDHSMRVPRPDLAPALGVPEPCGSCHADRDSAWAAQIIETHFGPQRGPHFATTFAAANAADPGADAALAALVADARQPIMVRASALARLGGYRRGFTLDSIRRFRADAPLLRYAAPQAAASLAAESRWRLLAPLLDDELRAVRHQAVTALIPSIRGNAAYRERLEPYLARWREDQQLNLDAPETLTGLAQAQAALGDTGAAEASLTEALRLQPSWVPGLTNLADLYRATGRDPEAGDLLRKALALAPDRAETSYAYGLWLARQGRLSDSVAHLERAASLAPDERSYAYAWALALNDSGAEREAVGVLQSLLGRWPDDADLLLATATMLRDQGRYAETLPLLERLLAQRPRDRQLQQFRDAMQSAAGPR